MVCVEGKMKTSRVKAEQFPLLIVSEDDCSSKQEMKGWQNAIINFRKRPK